VVQNPKRFHGSVRGTNHFPGGNNVGIGPKTSAKFIKIIVSHAARVKKGFQRLNRRNGNSIKKDQEKVN